MSSNFGSSQSEWVRLSKSLNKGENAYIEERMVKIEKCLEDNGINLKVGSVPHIAVLGSGGGERAMLGLLGCLDQMGQDNLLDSVLYLCGVSGSTWCMSILYEDPDWSSNLLSLKPKLIKRLTETPTDLSKIIGWLTEAIKHENYSLTDIWAATVTYACVKGIDRSQLSGQKQRDATNPYPIYAVVDKGLKQDGQTAACWFELSPHEAGYSHVGAFIDTSAFGCQFEAGVLKQKLTRGTSCTCKVCVAVLLQIGKKTRERYYR
ncbi:hypothetical protein AAFF_G00222150 [Aldrovandia affinis]|uniref:PLA2c domain-containing protein n=1 Tax=Aldrovandia affinis TaxID=143900 RepID=A0AAD7W569_9TELE|nr:hypothetical protein AAFF_G00222150 [Aldrovandia affinis]